MNVCYRRGKLRTQYFFNWERVLVKWFYKKASMSKNLKQQKEFGFLFSEKTSFIQITQSYFMSHI